MQLFRQELQVVIIQNNLFGEHRLEQRYPIPENPLYIFRPENRIFKVSHEFCEQFVFTTWLIYATLFTK